MKNVFVPYGNSRRDYKEAERIEQSATRAGNQKVILTTFDIVSQDENNQNLC